MNDPWQLFGLDPHTANEKDIKVAYARLLKQHRPDVDPVGFRRVYDAYQRALEWVERSRNGKRQDLETDDEAKRKREPPPSEVPPLASRDEKKDSPPEANAKKAPLEPSTPPANAPDTQEPPPKPTSTVSKPHTDSNSSGQDVLLRPSVPSPKASRSQAYESKLIELKRLLHGWHFPWSVRRAFDAVSRAFDAASITPAKRSLEWRAVFDGDPELLARRIPDSALVSLIHLDEFLLCYDVACQWHSQGRWKRMAYLGRALIEGNPERISPMAGDFIVFLSQRLAVVEPEIADKLASMAFLLLKREERDEFANAIAREVWLGRQLLQIQTRYRRFWNVNLAHGAPLLEGTKYKVRRIVQDTVSLAPEDWAGWDVIRERMTNELQVKLQRWITERNGYYKLDILHLRDLVERVAFIVGRVALALLYLALTVVATCIVINLLKDVF